MTTSNNSQPKGDELKLTTAQTAVPAAIPAKTTVMVGGVSYTVATLAAYITTLLAPILAAKNAKLAFTQAVQAREANQKAVQNFLVELRAAMIALFGRSSPILVQFGFAPAKAKSTKSGKNVVKTAKSLATRLKLGTLGAQQKAQKLAQPPPAFTVDAKGTVSLVTPSDASNTAPASDAETASGSASNGANGVSTPASTAASGSTPLSGS